MHISKELLGKDLFKFASSSIIMMVFLQSYQVVDGLFVANLISTDAFSALNLVYPYVSLLIAINIMLGTGSSAIIAAKLAKRDLKGANATFSSINYIALGLSVLISIVSMIFIDDIIYFLGSDDSLYQFTYDYLRIIIIFSPAIAIQSLYESFFVTASKPKLGLYLIIGAGLFNIVFDYIFIEFFNLSISGAALATGLGYCIPMIYGIIYFIFNKTTLKLGKGNFNKEEIFKTCVNGSSEMVVNLATSITSVIFNVLMMFFIGPNGVAAISAILYLQFLFNYFFFGYIIGIAPIISYHHSIKNNSYLKKVLKSSYKFIFITSIALFITAFISADLVASIYSNNNQDVYNMIITGQRIFSISFLFAGINIFASGYFTAIHDGIRSAKISFYRTFLVIMASTLILSYFFGYMGVFMAIPVAEIVSAFYSIRQLKKVKIYD